MIEREVMSVEIYCLVATAVLLLALAFVSTALYGSQFGNPALMGNREGIAPPTGAAGRARRAHLNLLENAVPFALVILSAQVIGATSGVTQTAALVFIIARVVHAVVYLVGISGIRTLAWLVGVVATIVIVVAIIF